MSVSGGFGSFRGWSVDGWGFRRQKARQQGDCIDSCRVAENVRRGINFDLGLFLGGNGNHE